MVELSMDNVDKQLVESKPLVSGCMCGDKPKERVILGMCLG
jgi:hypothetical protein